MPQGPAIIVDQLGNPISGTFGKVLPTTNIAGTATGTSAGVPIGGLNPSSLLTPLAIDPYGSLTVRPGVCPTFSAVTTSLVSTGITSGKSMLSIMNASVTNWCRVVAVYAQCPPQVNTTSGLLGIGSGTSYTQIIFGVYRMTGHSGGTLLTKVAADPTDDAALDANITIRTGATITGQASAPMGAWDASYDAAVPIGPRADMCLKVWTLPPGGYGLTITNVNTLSTAISFLMTATCSQNIA